MITIVIGMIMIVGLAQAQKLDAVIENGIGNIGGAQEFNHRTFGLAICPIRIGDNHPTLIGLYGETNEVYYKNEDDGFTGRFVQWHTGLSFNTKMGMNEEFFLRIRGGYGQSTTRGFGSGGDYIDKQRDNLFVALIFFANYQEENYFFSRHALSILYRQPLSSKKTATWQGNEIASDSIPTWDNQLVRAYITETPVSFFLDNDQDWKMNLDISVGYGSESRLVDKLPKKIGYWMLGAGISIFKVPYFQQNVLEIGGEFQFMEQTRFILNAKINLVPLIFLIWDKEEIEIKLNSYNFSGKEYRKIMAPQKPIINLA